MNLLKILNFFFLIIEMTNSFNLKGRLLKAIITEVWSVFRFFLIKNIILIYEQNVPHILKYFEKDSQKSFNGYEISIFKEMSKKFNFTYQIEECHQDWGRLLPDGNWTGIIGSLVNQVNTYSCFSKVLNKKYE